MISRLVIAPHCDDESLGCGGLLAKYPSECAVVVLAKPDDVRRKEFEEARQRELARLNLRISSITGQTCHTPEDLKLLAGDSGDRRLADMATVRRWTENSARHRGGVKTA